MLIHIDKDNLEAGVISDTHGLFRQEIRKYFSDVDLIIHAGDIGSEVVINELEKIAPVYAVLGNVDNTFKFPQLSETCFLKTQNSHLLIIHDCSQIDLDPAAAGFNGVICGHTHLPRTEQRKGILYLNPGSAGPRRFSTPISLARLSIKGNTLNARLISIEPV